MDTQYPPAFRRFTLQENISPWLDAVILGLLWAVLHLSAYFVLSKTGALNFMGMAASSRD